MPATPRAPAPPASTPPGDRTPPQLAQGVGVDPRGARRLVVDRAQQADGLGVEHLRGHALGLAQHLGPVLRVRVVAELGAVRQGR
jgi:hypothetical protein